MFNYTVSNSYDIDLSVRKPLHVIRKAYLKCQRLLFNAVTFLGTSRDIVNDGFRPRVLTSHLGTCSCYT